MTGSLPSALRCYGLYKGPFCIGAVVIGYPMNDAMYSVGCMTNTAASSSAPYQQESSLRDRARQAIATGDQAAARALLHQLFVEEPDDRLSASLTDAVVATASIDIPLTGHDIMMLLANSGQAAGMSERKRDVGVW
jgi:hypothetical protein